MKKITAALISTAVLASAVPFSSFTAYADEPLFTYYMDDYELVFSVTDDSELRLLSVKGSGSTLKLPQNVNIYTFRTIEKDALQAGTTCETLVIPDTVRTIGEGAFKGCETLKTVSIGSGVSSIGNYAFSGCPNLQTFTVNKGNASYSAVNSMLCNAAGTALVSYAGKTDAVIPDTVTSIRAGAFFGSPVKSVSFPSGLMTIGNYAFSGSSISSISIPDSVISIGTGCFMDCDELTDVDLGKGVTTIPNECFSLCSSLESFGFGMTETISDYAFYGCPSLLRAYIPQTVDNIGKSALGMHSDSITGEDTPYYGFCVIGTSGSSAESYCKEYDTDFLDPEKVLYGDINGDLSINPVDATDALKAYTNAASGKRVTLTEFQKIAGDIDHDGSLTPVDATAILTAYTKAASEKYNFE